MSSDGRAGRPAEPRAGPAYARFYSRKETFEKRDVPEDLVRGDANLTDCIFLVETSEKPAEK